MKLESAITRLAGAQTNVQNAISFLEVQDGVMEAAGKILNRMIELKGLSQDVMKNSSDVANYNREFQDLQMQIFDMTTMSSSTGLVCLPLHPMRVQQLSLGVCQRTTP